jgi:hypothetical protein
MSCDAFFFTIDWNKRNQIHADFWEACLDENGELINQCSQWICQVADFRNVLGHWDVANEANMIYEVIRELLEAEHKNTLDFIFSQLFSNDTCTFWKDFEEQEAPQGDWLAEIDFSACLSPDEIDEILSQWSEELKSKMKEVYPLIVKPRFLITADDFLWYVEAWISLLRDVKEKKGLGLIWKISY